jgi:membrane protease YdiL (CAAX protease family)
MPYSDNLAITPITPDMFSRIRSLGCCDKLLFLLTFAWTIVGILANYFRVRGPRSEALLFWSVVALILWVAVGGVIAYSVIRQQRRPADYGLSFQRGGVASFVLLALIHIYLAISGQFVLYANGSFMWSAAGAFMEELVFRSFAIDKFILLMEGIKRKAFWAILPSSVLWSLPHLPSKSPSQLLGIFLGGLFFGYLYYKSRSILLPAWIHSVANAGYMGGVLIAALYCVLAVADCAIGSRNKQTPQVAVASRNT